MLDGKTGEVIQKMKQQKDWLKFVEFNFDYFKGRDDGLEAIVNLQWQYDLTDRKKKEILGILSE